MITHRLEGLRSRSGNQGSSRPRVSTGNFSSLETTRDERMTTFVACRLPCRADISNILIRRDPLVPRTVRSVVPSCVCAGPGALINRELDAPWAAVPSVDHREQDSIRRARRGADGSWVSSATRSRAGAARSRDSGRPWTLRTPGAQQADRSGWLCPGKWSAS
jgi:hypothetical protein